jgi:hypothetical protein
MESDFHEENHNFQRDLIISKNKLIFLKITYSIDVPHKIEHTVKQL